MEGARAEAAGVEEGGGLSGGGDQTLTIDPTHLRFVFQGLWDRDKSGRQYSQLPWRIGMLTPVGESRRVLRNRARGIPFGGYHLVQ